MNAWTAQLRSLARHVERNAGLAAMPDYQRELCIEARRGRAHIVQMLRASDAPLKTTQIAVEAGLSDERPPASARAATEEAKNLRGECLMLSDVLRDAYEVVKTVEGEDGDEADRLAELRMSIKYALAAYDERRISTANADVTGLAPGKD